MIPQDFETLACDIVSAGRCLVEMPAGTGKTQLLVMIAGALVRSGKRVLVLTHTNAGVAAISERCRRLGVSTHGVRIVTISSWAEKVACAYPASSGMGAAPVGRGDSDYFARVVRGAGSLLDRDWFRQVVASSYQALLVDEYQDCSKVQHAMIEKLSGLIRLVACFGDPLQRIFDFSGEEFPRWSDVRRSFAPFEGIEPYPHRWEGHNFDLGEWLTYDLREALEGSTFEKDGSDIQIPRFDSNIATLVRTGDHTRNSRGKLISKAYCLADFPGSSLVICPSNPPGQDASLAKSLGRRYRLPEEIEGKYIRHKIEGYLEAKEAGSLDVWLVDLIKGCSSGAAAALDKTVCGALSNGKSIDCYLKAKNRRPYAGLLTAIEGYVQAPSVESLGLVDVALQKSPASLYRAEAWGETLWVVRDFERFGGDPFELLRTRRGSTRFSHGRFRGNIVSRTLLVKGLEFTNVMVTDAGNGYDPRNLYVALTRATDRLLIAC
jgi:hypothetical protein